MLASISLQVATTPSITYAQEASEDAYDDGATPDPADDETDLATLSGIEAEGEESEETVPASYSASDEEKADTAGVPTSFSGKNQCIAEVSKKDLKKAKSYSEVRAKNRLVQLKKYDVRINNANKKIKKSYKVEAKKYKIDSKTDFPRTTHRKAVKQEIANAGKQISSKRKAAKSATTPQAVAEQVCSMVYDIRIYTYLDAKISKQSVIDKLYRYNGLAIGQYKTLQADYNKLSADKKKKAEKEMTALTDPQVSRTKIDDLQKKLDTITPESINQEQSSTKKKASVIFTERLKADIEAGNKALSADIKKGNAAKKALKAANTGTSKGNKNTRTTKKTLTTKQINDVCKDENTKVLQVKDKLNKTLTSACNVGIKEGYKKKGDASDFCKTGGGKWKASKSPAKVKACERGYKEGVNIRTTGAQSCFGVLCT